MAKNKNWILLAGALGLALGAWFLFRPKPKHGPAHVDVTPKTKFADLIREAPMKSEPLPEAAKQDIPPECTASWELMMRTSINDWLDRVASKSSLRDPKCTTVELVDFPKTFGGYPPEECFDPDKVAAIRRGEKSPELDKCNHLLFFYRAFILSQATKHLPADTLSTAILSNKIMIRFFELFNNPQALQDIRDWNGLLRRENPDLYPSYKLELITEFVGDKPGDNVSRLTEQMRERFGDVDPEISAAELTDLVVREKWEDMAEHLARAEQAYPGDSRWDYFRAYMAWHQEDRGLAARHVQEALKKSPDNQQYKATLDNLKTAAFGTKGVFALNLGFRFEDL
ncbi:tetratricopeptide repeat protein [bacterium]|nr:tetratricopeptide repeat protein [bacterium]